MKIGIGRIALSGPMMRKIDGIALPKCLLYKELENPDLDAEALPTLHIALEIAVLAGISIEGSQKSAVINPR